LNVKLYFDVRLPCSGGLPQFGAKHAAQLLYLNMTMHQLLKDSYNVGLRGS
jgi:hypothetical protein